MKWSDRPTADVSERYGLSVPEDREVMQEADWPVSRESNKKNGDCQDCHQFAPA